MYRRRLGMPNALSTLAVPFHDNNNNNNNDIHQFQ